MGPIRKLFTQSSYYLAANLLVVLAGAISLPIWTRLLSQQDYGLFSLFNVTIALMVAFSKFGLQHSSLRFFSDVKTGKMPLGLSSYFSTMLIGAVCISGTVTAIIMLFVIFFMAKMLDPALLALLPFIGAIILIQATNNLLTIFIRAEQQVKLYSLIYIISRYSQLALAVLFVFLLGANLHNVYWGWIISGGIILLWLTARLVFLNRLSPRHFSPAFLKEAIMYGFPLIWFELSNTILSIGDRYILQYYMGSTAVGIYSVGYNTADLAQSILTIPIRLAVIPIYLSLWNTESKENTQKFLGQALKYYCMVGIPMSFVVSWYSKDIVTLLATAKFVEAYTIVPYIILPLIVYGAFGIYGAGLYIQKKTTLLMYSTLSASGINIGINLVLIPHLGILGAAIATLVAYVFLAVMIFVRSYHYLKVPIDLLAIGRYAILSMAALYLTSTMANAGPVAVKIAIVIVLYAGGLLLFDAHLRAKVRSLVLNQSGA